MAHLERVREEPRRGQEPSDMKAASGSCPLLNKGKAERKNLVTVFVGKTAGAAEWASD